MTTNQLDIAGVAYICSCDDCPGFVGVLVTRDKEQINLTGRLHTCSPELLEDEDHHTCCFDDSSQKLDLVVTRVNEFDFDDRIVVPHVMKTVEDNFTLSSRHVQFYTDELLVGNEAENIAVKYVSEKLSGGNCIVCIGKMKIKYPLE